MSERRWDATPQPHRQLHGTAGANAQTTRCNEDPGTRQQNVMMLSSFVILFRDSDLDLFQLGVMLVLHFIRHFALLCSQPTLN